MSGTNPSGQNQGFPNLDAPFVDPNLYISIPWYQLLVSLWRKTGGSIVPANVVMLTSTTVGGKAQPIVLATSPFQFTATEGGQLLVTWPYSLTPQFSRESGGEVIEFSRDGGTNWYLVGSAPRMVQVSAQDTVRVTWFTPGPPTVVFFPIQ